MKKSILYLLTLVCPLAIAEPINLSLNATKNATGLGERLVTLDPNKTYQFRCKLTPKDLPPAGTILLDITVCDINQLHHCPYAYSEGHADLKQFAIAFEFSPQKQYMGKQNTFSVIMQYLPLSSQQTALARYELSCNYRPILK